MKKTDISAFKSPLYKSYKMEEALDIYFYHPLGFLFAKLSHKARLKPNQVSLISMIVGVIGGVMLVSMKTALTGVLLIIFSSVLDSSDGQLARMTGYSSLSGRILDGLIGYACFTAAYIAMALNYFYGGGGTWIFGMLILAGASSAFQSSMYDYYRTTFARITSGESFVPVENKSKLTGFFSAVYSAYGACQNIFASNHMKMLKKIRAMNIGEDAGKKIARLYEKRNIRNVHIWNMLGDNAKIIGILLVVIFGAVEWYFYYILVLLNLIFAVAFFIQKNSDSKFMAEVSALMEE